MLTRREFTTLALSSLSWPGLLAQTASSAGGVTLGAQSYSFRQLTRPPDSDMSDVIIQAFTECGLRDCELWSPMLEPAKVAREELRRWRIETPLDHFAAIRKKFDNAKIAIRAYNYSFNDSFTDPEIDRGFEVARALGAGFITASSTLTSAKRVAPFAEKHKMMVAMHNHSNVKDRKRDQGANVEWGTGDAPIREVLQLLKQNKWPIAAYLEYEYKGAGTPVDEVKKGLAFMQAALA